MEQDILVTWNSRLEMKRFHSCKIHVKDNTREFQCRAFIIVQYKNIEVIVNITATLCFLIVFTVVF